MAISSAVLKSSIPDKAKPMLQTASEHGEFITSVQPTGLWPLDELLRGGIPQGKITEVAGVMPSGKTSLTLSLLAEATRSGKLAAYIDTFSSLDPEYAFQAGIALEHLLWVRCQNFSHVEDRANSYEKALKASDILARSGDFSVVVLDMIQTPKIHAGDNPCTAALGDSHNGIESGGKNFPMHAWFRLQRALKGTSTAFVVLSSRPLSGRAASVLLSFQCTCSHWVTAHSPLGITGRFPSLALGNQLQGIETKAQIIRGMTHGSITVYCRL